MNGWSTKKCDLPYWIEIALLLIDMLIKFLIRLKIHVACPKIFSFNYFNIHKRRVRAISKYKFSKELCL